MLSESLILHSLPSHKHHCGVVPCFITPISSHGCVAFLAVPEVFSVLLVTDHILLLFFQQFARDVTPRTDLALSLTIASKTMFLCLFLLTLQPCAQVATSYLVH